MSDRLLLTLGVGVPVLLALIGASWKAAAMRSDFHHKWSERVDRVRASLDEMTLASLEAVRDQLNASLPAEVPFDPSDALVDVDAILGLVASASRYNTMRQAVERQLRSLLRVGRIILTGLILAFISVIGIIACSAQADVRTVYWWLGGSVLSVSILLLALATVLYVWCEDHLSTAEQTVTASTSP